MASRKYRCHQLLPMVYGLNNSFSKLIQVGLENSTSGSKDFKPVVRISAGDFYGFSFTIERWELFKKEFEQINKFFHAQKEEELLDQRISIPGFTIRFMISYSDRAFEIIEESEDGGEPSMKKFRKSMVFKRVTFDRLVNVSKCIDCRIKYLCEVEKSLDLILSEVSNYVKNKLQSEQNSKYTYFTSNNVEYALRNIDTNLINNVNNLLREKNLSLLVEDITILLYEFLSFHLYNLVTMLSNSVYTTS